MSDPLTYEDEQQILRTVRDGQRDPLDAVPILCGRELERDPDEVAEE